MAASQSVVVLLGNSDGTFQLPVPYAVTGGPSSVAAGDVNGDGKTDLAASLAHAQIAILLGKGDGSFQPPVNYAVPSAPYTLVLAGFNGDGKLDLATSMYSVNEVSVLLGNGDGSFQPPVVYQCGYEPFFLGSSIAVADFGGNGKLDVAVAHEGFGGVGVLFGDGDGTFQHARYYVTGMNGRAVTVGDFNRDGKPDIAVANAMPVEGGN